MELTKSELASHIQKLNCLYTEYTDKMISHMEIGHCDFECMYNKAWLVKSYIRILNRFYTDGQDCTCTVAGSWFLDHLCGYIDSPYTDYTCYYNWEAEGVQNFIASSWTFNTDLTVSATFQNDNFIEYGTYTYDSSTKQLTLSGIDFFALYTVSFSENCSEMIFNYNDPDSNRTVIGYFKNITVNSESCTWKENCHTEETINKIIQHSYSLLGSNCKCN